jgi:YD repeat-containing protein
MSAEHSFNDQLCDAFRARRWRTRGATGADKVPSRRKTRIGMLLFATVIAVVSPTHAAVISYSYDNAGRLTRVNYGGFVNTAYKYDANGNLLSRVNSTAPLPLAAARYLGLVTNASPSAGNEGLLSLELDSHGAFSGKLSLGGKSYNFRGVFASDGTAAPIVINRKAPLGPLTLTLSIDLTSGDQQVTGTLSDGTFTSELALNRAVFNKKTNPAPASLVGKFTALFQPTSSAAGTPQGDGFAAVSVDTSGRIRMAGQLADGTKITQGAVLSNGDWPLFVLLYKKQGFLSGVVSFQVVPDTSDFAGDLDWLKPGAFTNKLQAIGSRYIAPPKGQRVLNFANTSPNAHLTTTAGNIAPPLDKAVTLTTANKIEVSAFQPERLKLSIKVPTGVMSGSFLDSGKTRKLNGVIFQKQNLGSGFFLGTSESGLFELTEQP